MSKVTFKVSDESVNSHGFYVKTSGIRLDEFRSNPVMLYLHNGELLPIGLWENLRVENNELLADAIFDTDDAFAREIERKVQKGFIKGASMGLTNYTLSDDPALMKPGQTRPAVVESTLYEISITPLPSNRNALKLRGDTKLLNLSEAAKNEIDTILPLIKIEKPMKQLLLKLGLAEDATEAIALTSVDALQKENDTLRKSLKLAFEKLGIATGAITSENRERMMKLAETDFELALSFIEPAATGKKDDDTGKKPDTPDTLRLSDLIKELRKPATGDDPYGKYTFSDYQEKAPEKLEMMREKEPEKFKALYKAEFGTDYKE